MVRADVESLPATNRIPGNSTRVVQSGSVIRLGERSSSFDGHRVLALAILRLIQRWKPLGSRWEEES